MPTAGSFGAASFGVRITGAERTTSADISEMHIPGSDINIIDVGGKLANHINYELYFANAAAYNTLDGLVGTSGTLVAYDINATAYLKSLKRTFVQPVGSNATTATAEFVIP